MRIEFGSKRHLAEFGQLDVRLYPIIWDLCRATPPGFALRVTSIYRTPSEDKKLGGSGIHSIPKRGKVASSGHRAIDFAAPDWEFVKSCAPAVNEKWVYDPRRILIPVITMKAHGTGAHFHVQVHPNTIEVGRWTESLA